MRILRSFYGSTNTAVRLAKPINEVMKIRQEYNSFKKGSEEGKVPFSVTRRNRVERTYDKFDKLNGYG